jgi:CubicO group peptidase (beta-lactamase class C family)
LNKLVEFGRPPGLSLAVVKDNETVYLKSFGLADGPNNIAVTPDTVFQWMSLTKIATAIAIFQLHECHALELTDSVVKHLPFFQVHYPSRDSEQVTIWHLLNHSSGLAHPTKMMGMFHLNGQPYPDQVELAKQLVEQNGKLNFEPGTRSRYTNLGYTVLGAIVETLSGQPFHEYLVEHIFRPLGMDNSNHNYTEAMRAKAAVGSQLRGSILNVMLPVVIEDLDAVIRDIDGDHMWFKLGLPNFSGGAGINGTIVDLSRFVMAFLNGGELDGRRILSPESVNTMVNEGHTPAKGGPADYYQGLKHGLGWFIWPNGRRQGIMHNGDGPGFSTIMQLYPKERLGVIVLGNEWAYGTSLRGTSIRDSIAHLAASIDWH